jgi:hypothetical protein
MEKTSMEKTDAVWKNLYTVGGVAPLITLIFYLSEFSLAIFGEAYPATAEGWFSLFQRSKLLGLWYLNALDIISIAFMGVMFLALYTALRRGNESVMAIATFFSLTGVTVFVATRSELVAASLALSDRYAAAATEVQRAPIVAAWQAVSAIGQPTPQTTGFLLMTVAVLIISAVMLRGTIFGKATAWVGILAGIVTILDDVCVVLVPSIAIPLMGLCGILWIVWWILISIRLFRLGRLEMKS